MVDKDLIEMGQGERKADLLIRNGLLVNVITGEIYKADVAVGKDKIVATGDLSKMKANRTIDAAGKYVVPGLVDSHIHVEVTKLSITRFAELVLPHGTTSVMTGLDQIAAVSGLKGMRLFLDEAKNTHLKVFTGVAVKLPYTTPSSTIGHELGPEEHRIAQKWKEVIGTWETTSDFILTGDADAYEAVDMAYQNKILPHGHCPVLTGPRLAAYLTVGIRSDHESISKDEALEKVRNGLYVLIRETPVAPNMEQVIKIVTEEKIDPRHVCLCTDDINVKSLFDNGHLDNLVRKAVKYGVSPIEAIQMVTINPAEAYRMDHLIGSIAPGKSADIILVDDLRRFRVSMVISSGEQIAEGGRMLKEYVPPKRPKWLLNTFRVPHLEPLDLAVKSPYKSKRVKVISMFVDEKNNFYRFKRETTLDVEGGLVKSNPREDVLYVSIVERYSGKGLRSTAFISGFNMAGGAVATSLSPDDENIVSIGTNLEDMAHVINYISEKQGGQAIVKDGKVLAELGLPIGGICTDLPAVEVRKKEEELNDAIRALGSRMELPFMAMIFLPITAIPEYAMTDRGLVECATQKYINPVLGPA
ncbi:MAG: adenine deaminase C-terminal domain-containing protein [Conexivisphaerales archaeon]